MNEKILGYVLIALGLAIIFLGFAASYPVLTGKASAYELFNLPGIEMDFSSFVGLDSPQGQNLQVDQSRLKTEIVKPEHVNEPLNLFFFIMFMGFIVTVGFKIASIGVMLVRPIQVKLQEKKSN